MENLSAEVGHKMRSAVKAKLIEMGTGGSAGYIDDELPDYVMIMVANKRSKQQMTDDLTLFLGDNTPQFVDWLYLVLQKLQEVAIPAAAVAASSSAASGKSSKSKQSSAGGSKDAKRADKKSSASKKTDIKSSSSSARRDDDDDRGNTPPPPPTSSASSSSAAAQPSITDVFAEHLIQKARTTVAAEKSAAKSLKAEDAFDIPTMSEMVPAGPQTRRKELAALADLQKQINQAKRQLSSQAANHDGEPDSDGGDDDDADFINLNDEELAADEEDVNGKAGQAHVAHDVTAKRRASRVPITFREEPAAAAVAAGRERSSRPTTDSFYASPKPGRSSVLDRLGVRTAGESSTHSSSSLASGGGPTTVQQVASRVHDTAAASNHHRRGEQEIYVPSFRRKDTHNERNSDRDRNPERSNRDRDHRDRDPRADSSSRRDRERERERDMLRSRNPDRDAVGSRDRHPDRSRERLQPQATRLKDRLGAAVNSVPQLSSSVSAASNARDNRPDLRDRMRARSANRSRARSSEKSSAATTTTTSSSSGKQSRAIESKVLVAPAKPEYVELPVEMPVNSVVKVQPRPVIPPNRQACKSLLLRAMAEAQKSTALVKPRDETNAAKKLRDAAAKVTAVVDVELPTKLYTNSYRNKSNIVIQVARGESPLGHDDDDDAVPDSEVDTSEVEYVENIEYQEIADDSEEELHHAGGVHAAYVDEVDEEEDDMIADEDDEVAHDDMTAVGGASPVPEQSTQFVVTLDDIKNNKYAMRTSKHLQRQRNTTTTKTTATNGATAADGDGIEPDREESSSSPHTGERTTSSASQKVNKLIIQNDTDDEEELRKEVERSKSKAKAVVVVVGDTTAAKADNGNTKSSASSKKEISAAVGAEQEPDTKESRRKRRRLSPITFDLQAARGQSPVATKRKRSSDRGDRSSSRHRSMEADGLDGSSGKRSDVSRKYDNVPALAVTIGGGHSHHVSSEHRSKERCKYYPACGKGDSCEFSHPISTCKQFPLCKYGDQCNFFHPRCMFDLTCTKPNCNYSHSLVTTSKAPPLSSHVVPVSNYKSISNTTLPALCRFHPNCSNTVCTFYHPKACHYGRNCVNKIECSFWHGDNGHASGGGSSGGSGSGSGGKDKLKWFASSTVY